MKALALIVTSALLVASQTPAWKVRVVASQRADSIALASATPNGYGGWNTERVAKKASEANVWVWVRAELTPPAGERSLAVADIVLTDSRANYPVAGVTIGSPEAFYPVEDFPQGLGVGNAYLTIVRGSENVVLAMSEPSAAVYLLFQLPRTLTKLSLAVKGGTPVPVPSAKR